MYSEFCAILKNVPFKIKTDLVTFWGTFEKIGLLLISASGHTSKESIFSKNIWNCWDTASLFHISSSFSNSVVRKNVDVWWIRTLILGVEGKHADH